MIISLSFFMQNTLLFDFEMKYDSPMCIYNLIIVIVLSGDAYKSNYFYKNMRSIEQ